MLYVLFTANAVDVVFVEGGEVVGEEGESHVGVGVWARPAHLSEPGLLRGLHLERRHHLLACEWNGVLPGKF